METPIVSVVRPCFRLEEGGGQFVLFFARGRHVVHNLGRCRRMFASGATESILHAKATNTTALSTGSLSLHLLGNLDVDLEELGHAAVEADRFALVQIGFAVAGGDALLGAGLDKTAKLVSTR